MDLIRRAPGGGWHRLLALLTASLLLLAACGEGDDGGVAAGDDDAAEPADEGEPQQGGEIVVALESETNNWLPGSFAGTQAGVNVARSIYDPLMLRNEEGEIAPYLAESLEADDDLTEWTLTLREGVRFHDGTPLDAEALKYNFDTLLKAEGSNTAGALRDFESMDVVDELTVRYNATQPNATLPDLLQGSPGWPVSPTAHQELGDDLGNQPVGTGPFRFVSWTRDESFVAERNDDYWQEGLPYLDRITFRPITDEDTRVASLEAGDVDGTHSVRLSAMLARVNALDGVDVHLGPGNSGSGAIFNTERPPVDDPRIRRSLSYALDQRQLIGVIAGGAADETEARTQYFRQESQYHSEEVAEAWPTDDPEEAQRLHDEYVNDPGRSDGQPAGSPVQIEFNCTAIASLQEQAQAYQGMWQAVGYQVQLNAVEQSVHIQNAIAGDYMVNCWRQGGDADPYIVLSNAFGPPEEQPLNFTNYHNETVADVLETLRTTFDVDERAEAIEELGLLFAEDVPNTWTGSNNEFIAVQDEVRGVTTWTFPDGTRGDGAHTGTTTWGQVWLDR
jgi:peptide/nickel transport system substrate-binding protein